MNSSHFPAGGVLFEQQLGELAQSIDLLVVQLPRVLEVLLQVGFPDLPRQIHDLLLDLLVVHALLSPLAIQPLYHFVALLVRLNVGVNFSFLLFDLLVGSIQVLLGDHELGVAIVGSPVKEPTHTVRGGIQMVGFRLIP